MFEQVWAFAHFYLEFDSAQYVTKLGHAPLGEERTQRAGRPFRQRHYKLITGRPRVSPGARYQMGWPRQRRPGAFATRAVALVGCRRSWTGCSELSPDVRACQIVSHHGELGRTSAYTGAIGRTSAYTGAIGRTSAYTGAIGRSIAQSRPRTRSSFARNSGETSYARIRRRGLSGAIRQRAAERRIKDSAYIAALVRGHVAADPPLATYELAAFNAAVSVLAWFGRACARTAREAAQAGVLPRDLQQDLSRSRALVADVERRMHEFARAALVSCGILQVARNSQLACVQ